MPGKRRPQVAEVDRLLALVAGRVRSLRDGKGWTQSGAAEKAGLSFREFQRLEAGEMVSLTTLVLVARAFGTTVSVLTRPGARSKG